MFFNEIDQIAEVFLWFHSGPFPDDRAIIGVSLYKKVMDIMDIRFLFGGT
jgi:hypothetical protein